MRTSGPEPKKAAARMLAAEVYTGGKQRKSVGPTSRRRSGPWRPGGSSGSRRRSRPALALPTRAKAAWVRAMPAMALVEVIDDNNRGGDDHLEHGPLPFGSGRVNRAVLHGDRINPRTYPANVACVSSVSPGQKSWRRRPGAAMSMLAVEPISRSAGRSRRGPSAWPPGRAGSPTPRRSAARWPGRRTPSSGHNRSGPTGWSA